MAYHKVLFCTFLVLASLISVVAAAPLISEYDCISDPLFSGCFEQSRFPGLISCALETDANGDLVCGSDDVGGPGTAVWTDVGTWVEPNTTFADNVLIPSGWLGFGHVNLNISGIFAGSDLLRISSNESMELIADETLVIGAFTANDEFSVDGADIEFSQFTNCYAFETDGSGSLSCRTDEIDYSAGDGLALNEEAREFSLMDCASQEILKRNGDDTAWICAADNDSGSSPPDIWVNITGDNMTGNLTITNANLTVDGSVGIGTTAPAEPLHILADSANQVMRLEEFSGGEYYTIEVDSAGNLEFKRDVGVLILEILDAANQIRIGPGGDAASPSIAGTIDSNTGMFWPEGDALAFSAGATEFMRFNENGIDVTTFNGDSIEMNANVTISDNVTLLNFLSCTALETDVDGELVCGSDGGGEDTQKNASGPYLYNDTTTIYFNETYLNQTIENRLESVTHLPYNVTVNYGTIDAGNLTSILTPEDNDTLNISEVGGVNALELIINFTNVTDFNSILLRLRYIGGQGHEIVIGLYDYPDFYYEEEYGDITDQAILEYKKVDVFDASVHINETNVSFRFRHEQTGITSHDLILDYIALIDGFSTITNTEHDSMSGRDNIENHPWALPTDGSRAMSGNLNMSGNNMTSLGWLLFSDGVQIGNDTTMATNSDDVAIGHGAEASGSYATSLGFLARASGFASLALADYAVAEGISDLAIGNAAYTSTATSGISIGNNANVTGDYSICIGRTCRVSGDNSLGLGYNSIVESANTFNLSNVYTSVYLSSLDSCDTIDTDGDGLLSCGTDSDSYPGNGIFVNRSGDNMTGDLNMSGNDIIDVLSIRTLNDRVLIGTADSTSSGIDSISIGKNSTADSLEGIAIGENSYVSSGSSRAIALGKDSYIDNSRGFAMGDGSRVSGGGQQSVAIGMSADVDGSFSSGINNVNITASWANAIGYNTDVSGTESIALGTDLTVSGTNSFLVGHDTTLSSSNTFYADYDTVIFPNELMIGDLISIYGDLGNITIGSNITADYYFGNGSQLTGLNHTIDSHSDTSATGTELDTLTDNSMSDTLHRHSELSASDGSPDRVVRVLTDGSVVISGENLHIDADSRGLFLGEDSDVSASYTGTNFKIVPDNVGSGGVWIHKGDFDAVEFGDATDTNYALISTMRDTDAGESIFGAWIAGQYDGASTMTKGVFGFNSFCYFTSNANSTSRCEAGFYEPRLSGTGTIAKAGGLRTRGQMTAAGTLTEHYGLEVLDFSNTGGGTVTKNYGVKINELDTATNNVGLAVISDTIGLTLGAGEDTTLRYTGSFSTLDSGIKIGTPSTNYAYFDDQGDLSFTGSAGFYPRRIRQAAIPASGEGATQIAVSEMIFWVDSDDDSVHLVYNDATAGIKSVALA